MSATTSLCPTEGGSERVRFFPRQLISAEDLVQEQNYHRQKLRTHNRILHGWGVVCGCEVVAAGDPSKPWQVTIQPGYVLTPLGDEIVIASQAMFDVATQMTQSPDPCAVSRPGPLPASPPAQASPLYLAVRYAECQARPVRVAPAGCVCDDMECEYSRIRDGYHFYCLTALPESHTAPLPSNEQLCNQTPPFACPNCFTDDAVVLATLTLAPPPSTTNPISDSEIALTDRRNLYSSAMVQQLGVYNCSRL